MTGKARGTSVASAIAVVVDRRPLGVSLLVFLTVCLILWGLGEGIPYGYDGIETYFTYLVGYNAAHFSGVNPLMADIAASPDPAAHPYYYTHHPNLFAHLLSQALIRVGFTDLRVHTLAAIAITAVGIFVGARVLAAVVGRAEAITYVLIAAVHYVGVLSWAPVLLRSFHFLFFWVAMRLLARYLEAPSPARLAAVGAWTYAVFLNDYTLGPFITLVQAMVVWTARRRLAATARALVPIALAAGGAIATWLTVLVLQFGADVVRQDIVYTFFARNAGERIEGRRLMEAFYRDHGIVFWGVLVESREFLGVLGGAWRNALTLGHGLLGPAIYLFAVTIAVTPEPYRRRWSRRLMRPTPVAVAVIATVVTGIAVGMTLAAEWLPFRPTTWVGALVILGCITFGATAVRRLERPGPVGADLWVWFAVSSTVAALLAAYLAATVSELRSGSRVLPDGSNAVPLGVVAGGAVLLANVVGCWRMGPKRFALALVSCAPAVLAVAVVVAVAAASVGAVAARVEALRGDVATWTPSDRGDFAELERRVLSADNAWPHVAELALLVILWTVASGAAAAVVVRLSRPGQPGALSLTEGRPNGDMAKPASPVMLRGYVIGMLVAIAVMSPLAVAAFTGNFVQTYKPALVFLEDVLLAVAVVRGVRIVAAMPGPSYRRAVVTFVVAVPAMYWLAYQARLAAIYPPTELGIAKVLHHEAYRGARFVDEAMYAAVWYYTRGVAHSIPWAAGEDGRLDLDALMFFSDRRARAAEYRRPEYLTCTRQHSEPALSCRRWVHRLREAGYVIRPGRNLLLDPDYLIFRFPEAEG